MSPRVILITGANSGVGFAASKVIAAASEDFHVIMASRSPEKGESALAELKAAGGLKGSLSLVQLDVTDDESIQKTVAYVEQEFGKLDALVNNAGVGNRDDNVRSRFEKTMAANVVGPAVVADAFRPLLLKSPKPYSIFVSSGVGSLGRASDPTDRYYRSMARGNAYRVSKAALNMMAIQEAVETESTALKVFAFCPGFVVSNLRGTSEEMRNPGGNAGDPTVSGKSILAILNGERDGDASKFVHKDGLYPW